MIDNILSLESQARRTFNMRNKFKTESRELMADREAAEILNITDTNW